MQKRVLRWSPDCMQHSPPHRLYFEIILGLLIIFTIFAITGEEQILEERLVIDNTSGMALNVYDDKENGGNSDIHLESEKNMQWHCILRDSYAYPYCGFEVLFDK